MTACVSSGTYLCQAPEDEMDRNDTYKKEQGQGGKNETEQPAEETCDSLSIIKGPELRDAISFAKAIEFEQAIDDEVGAQAIEKEPGGEGSGSEELGELKDSLVSPCSFPLPLLLCHLLNRLRNSLQSTAHTHTVAVDIPHGTLDVQQIFPP